MRLAVSGYGYVVRLFLNFRVWSRQHDIGRMIGYLESEAAAPNLATVSVFITQAEFRTSMVEYRLFLLYNAGDTQQRLRAWGH